MKPAKMLLLIVSGVAAIAIPMLAQAPSGVRPSFEVASVKLNHGPDNRRAIMGRGNRFITTGIPVKTLLAEAYHVQEFQLVGGPDWIASEKWDIEATTPPGTTPGPDSPVWLMLQSLFEDRFELRVHTEKKELPVYDLVVVKGGAKIKPSEDQTPFVPPPPGTPLPPPPAQAGGAMPRFSMRLGFGELQATAIPIENLVKSLSQQLGRTIVDKTELKGLYDFRLQWTPEVGQAQSGILGPAGPEPPRQVDLTGPSVFTAIQEQLGLKLESTRGPVEVVVIDRIQRPSEN